MVYRQICYKNFDKLQFRADLIEVNLGSSCHDPDLNSALEHFLKIVEKMLDQHAPYENIKHPKSQFETKPMISPGLAYSINKSSLQKFLQGKGSTEKQKL